MEKGSEMENVAAGGNPVFARDTVPNPVLASRQIEDLRKVLRRMRAYQPATLDTILSQKLAQLKKQN